MVRFLQAFIIVLTLMVVALVGAVLLLPRAFGWSTFIVLSGSMEPAMPVGGLAFVEPVSEDKPIQIGDVVTYPRPDHDDGTLVSHRVMTISDHLGRPTIWTIGDANETPDPWAVTDADVVGRVRYTIPYAGTWSQELRTTRGFLLIIALPALALILTESVRIVENLRAARRRPRSPEAEEARLLTVRDEAPATR